MFKDHLNKSKVTYFKHLAWALLAGFRLIYAGITSIIHGVVPTLFDGTAPKTIINIYHSHLVNHPNKEYNNMIEKAKKDNV
tara:strand:+ start:8483 stop:8725 length:243 start_codon:yes stop_codon:yes gene_type:complete